MTPDPTHPAGQRQRQAANPANSTWLAANAGSGKTRVLIDRVARLLLGGVKPQRILCLTYTKAAASEMQNRLFKRLGEWAMLDATALSLELATLGLPPDPGAEDLRAARQLFARAIETPGGLKIQTIHSFCASLLRRFPLEAGVTPHFSEMDDRTAARLRDDIISEMADDPRMPLIDAVAHLLTAEDFAGLTAEVARNRTSFALPLSREAALGLFDLPAGFTQAALLAQVFLGDEADIVKTLRQHLLRGSSNDVGAAGKLANSALLQPNLQDLELLEDVFLTGGQAQAPYSAKIGAFPTKETRNALGDLLPRLNNLMARVESARPLRLQLMAAEKTHALHAFATAFLPEYALRKAARGWLDFDDLILKARALLSDPGVAQWVLFRLDGGIDHILVDEAQDTSPDQWEVIRLLSDEFHTGHGARDDARTIFVVGDKKQSIYSFQGADLSAFGRMRDIFATRLNAIGQQLQDLSLDHSFRSSPAILGLVDATLQAGHGLGGTVRHFAFHADQPGRVDLWPFVLKTEEPEDKDWFDPVDVRTDQHATSILARSIARHIGRLIAAGTTIPTRSGPEPLQEGHILILVQRRAALFSEIIRACKAEGLAIAGADRLKLAAELAVRDLTALLSFVDTPEDDLSLASALRSPLLGWTEDQLYRLAQPRGHAFLWEALRGQSDAHPETLHILQDLRDRSDYLRPYDLIERILTRHGGRQRLLGRLGAEAEDGIDELLSQSLAYERTEVPSLTGFLSWLGADDAEVKRQPGGAARAIRVMTVHGAKGLEAPMVILPDTPKRDPQLRDELYTHAQGRVVWKTASDAAPRHLVALREDKKAAQAEENMRLLYVAMTRAESWLIVAGCGDPGKPGQGEGWYDLISQGLDRLQDQPGLMISPLAGDLGTGRRLSFGAWPANHAPLAVIRPAQTVLPEWALTSAPVAAEPLAPLAPSALGGAKVLPGEVLGQDDDLALRRGRQLHRLLEHLPLWPAAHWPDLARDLLTVGEDAAMVDELPPLLAEASAVLQNPALDWLFVPAHTVCMCTLKNRLTSLL